MGYFDFSKRVKKMFYFLEIEKAFVNEKGANFEIMAKSKCVLTYVCLLVINKGVVC